jgi:integrase/recombinase XerC
MENLSLAQAVDLYLDSVRLARSPNTARTYHNAMRVLMKTIQDGSVDPQEMPASIISEDVIVKVSNSLKYYAPSSEQLYLTAITGFFKFLAAEKIADVNLPRLDLLRVQRARRPGKRLPQFPRDEIEIILDYVKDFTNIISSGISFRLRAMRDRAFLFTLADTGLRVHEACNLRRGDIDWNEGRAVIIGKGDKQAVIRFSSRSLRMLREYLSLRAFLDGSSGRPLPSLPLFARHDKGAGKKVKPITTATGRNIVADYVRKAIGEEAEGRITPHSFRHYFVTTVLRASGNLKLAQELARHASIQVTQRYAHLSDDELDKGYHDIFS